VELAIQQFAQIPIVLCVHLPLQEPVQLVLQIIMFQVDIAILLLAKIHIAVFVPQLLQLVHVILVQLVIHNRVELAQQTLFAKTQIVLLVTVLIFIALIAVLHAIRTIILLMEHVPRTMLQQQLLLL